MRVPDLNAVGWVWMSYPDLLVPPPSWGTPTFVFVEEAADKSQKGQCSEVSQAGSNRRGNVVWVEPELRSANHYTNHQHSCGEETEETQSTG